MLANVLLSCCNPKSIALTVDTCHPQSKTQLNSSFLYEALSFLHFFVTLGEMDGPMRNPIDYGI